jgi:alpha-L-rhamnosidase
MTAQPEIPEVPANQRIEKVLATHLNEEFVRKAEARASKLHEWTDLPLSVISFEPDPEVFFKCRAVEQHQVSQLPSIPYGRGDQFILDFGSHRVGYFSFHLGADGVNIDAPARLRLTFGEVPYDVTEDLHPCKSWISTSWLPDETINVDWVPADVNMPR